MKKYYNWTTGLFSSTYNIYTSSTLVVSLKEKSFSQSARGIINGNEVIFKTKGFFKQHTDIFDFSNKEVIGRIVYNSWKTKSCIVFNDRTVELKAENIWNTKWKLSTPMAPC
ncbi:MAG: hypothetical protein ACLFNU_10130 [Bacteroidales bacterium]